ncbi:hypothetical protein GLOIN_2v1613593 [Rhizophagus irregularis DAOM 181602=DAOM 197198]|uniref:Uncharacterized protein n=1 Tax=Rhizophagus irregularis (strain DAOM 181602 / DAOM 197198 / MUCL 43194) TaxID=747089 RepID=A0A2P4PZK1_RHIID|nr:hypothetical protein GLOIN_2v1715828 [Rhizophagus irregularis DAOM 181602=DAOM 197198]XP_025177677.1 hypothetical protein GLOIN_2v1613593 [Rhizophagus irregularis DAOM 181602=DAOM 197198]POG60195.1 hypothetical protein GLOIN_2v1715828 [Rhizophagus irregularis DAOM 181602=DAOM 197198]POG70811.1 hypothetical protein GLOIN_2v1613593 [Rhizophagus irregularis DAOM 181602=DAOM 197198]|eukprot:XP_025167061.1 hypothetical protein GLOIN_2v1715828 [Rhizophagus irregularis DAOM 181602=DAOM 197198]
MFKVFYNFQPFFFLIPFLHQLINYKFFLEYIISKNDEFIKIHNIFDFFCRNNNFS